MVVGVVWGSQSSYLLSIWLPIHITFSFQVDEADFINFCAQVGWLIWKQTYFTFHQDPPLGDCVVRIFRAMIHTWNFLFERWSTGKIFACSLLYLFQNYLMAHFPGMFFQQTKPPKGLFSHVFNGTSNTFYKAYIVRFPNCQLATDLIIDSISWLEFPQWETWLG